ncbi:MAG: adenylate/guanylate cyclase domain-containing protein [Chloroflexota bacterium]
MNKQYQLESTIAFLESHRSLLSDVVVDAAIGPLRQELNINISSSQERRKQVTVLFADISNFTSMSEGLDAEDVRNIVQSLWVHLDTVIVEHGGTIDKHIGDAVMAIWGIEQTREDDPERAVRAALAMQRSVCDWRTELYENMPELENVDSPINVRIGINTGPAILGVVGTTCEFTAIGDTVNTAHRLEKAAPLGNILISHSTFLHVRGLFELRERDPISVKGKSKPLATYLVQRARPQQFRLEQQEIEGVKTPMIGRGDALHFLQEHFFEAILENCPQFTTIVGEAGIGKSRLLFEFNSWVESQSWRTSTFKVKARQEAAHVPYYLLRELLFQRFGVNESDSPEAIQQKMELGFFNEWEPESDILDRAHQIGSLIGCPPISIQVKQAPVAQAPSNQPRANQPRANQTVVPDEDSVASEKWQIQARKYLIQFFKAVSFTEPTVFLIEDIHWADQESLELLRETAESANHEILMIICTARPCFLEDHPTWCQETRFCAQHTLLPLSRAESRTLINAILYRAVDVPEELYEMVIGRAEGIPYHIEEFIKMLVNDQVIQKRTENWVVHPKRLEFNKVPTTLISMLEAQLDSLPVDELQILLLASTVGQTFWGEAIEHIIENLDESKPMSIAARLKTLKQKHLIVQNEHSLFENCTQFNFKHLLLQQVCYERILKRERRTYHELITDWMIDKAIDPAIDGPISKIELLVNHYHQAGHSEMALNYLIQEGRNALLKYAHVDALQILDKALAITEPVKHRWHYVLLNLRNQTQKFLSGAELQTDFASIHSLVHTIEKSIQESAS